MDSFCIWPCSCFFHFIAFGLRLSSLGFEEFSLFLDFSFFFLFIAFGLRLSGLFFHGFFFVFKPVASFSILLPLVEGRRV